MKRLKYDDFYKKILNLNLNKIDHIIKQNNKDS